MFPFIEFQIKILRILERNKIQQEALLKAVAQLQGGQGQSSTAAADDLDLPSMPATSVVELKEVAAFASSSDENKQKLVRKMLYSKVDNILYKLTILYSFSHINLVIVYAFTDHSSGQNRRQQPPRHNTTRHENHHDK